MYTYEQRKKAVELYIKFGFALRAVIRELGYPTSEQSIRNWYKEYQEKGNCIRSIHLRTNTALSKKKQQ